MMITLIQDQAVIINTHYNPFGRLKSTPFNLISFDRRFWEMIHRINRTSTLNTQYPHLMTTNRMDNFRRVYKEINKPKKGYVFINSGMYK
jgi:hypothetical protein